MSYSFNNPCWNCQKYGTTLDKCNDANKVQDAVSNIHMSNDGSHQGAGEIVLMCCRMEPKNKQ